MGRARMVVVASLSFALVPPTIAVGGAPNTPPFTLGPTRPVAAPVWDGALGTQDQPAVASDGTTFLAVWYDSRPGGLYGARISKSGRLLDPTGFPITDGNGSTQSSIQPPDLAWNGDRYLVVWRGYDEVHPPYWIFGALVSANGVVLSGAIPIATAPEDTQNPTVASDGSDFLVAWEDCGDDDNCYDNSSVLAARVTQDGIVLDPEGIPVMVGPATGERPSVAWNGTDYLVAWSHTVEPDPAQVRATRVAADGTVLDPDGIEVTTTGGQNPDIASAGGDWMILWTDGEIGFGNNVYATRVAADGSVTDEEPIVVADTEESENWPRLSWNGSEYLVVWDVTWPFASRITAAGQVLDPDGFPVTNVYGNIPFVGAAGEVFLVVWEVSDDNILGARVESSGEVLDPEGFDLARSSNHQSGPSLAWNGTEYLAAWRDARIDLTNDHLLAGRLDAHGRFLDADGHLIDGEAYQRELVWGGQNYLLVWYSWVGPELKEQAYGSRIGPDGRALDVPKLEIAVGTLAQQRPTVATDGTNFLVAYQDARTTEGDVYVQRVSADGELLDRHGIQVTTAAGGQTYPAVAWDGQNFLLVWRDKRAGVFDVYGTRVSSDGTVLDPGGIPISSVANSQQAPRVASNGQVSLVVWEDSRSGNRDLYATRVTADGQVLDPGGLPITTSVGDDTSPVVAWDGVNFVVAFEHQRPDGDIDVLAVRVTTGGVVIDPFPIGVATSNEGEDSVSITAGPLGTVAIAFDRFSPERYGTYRAFLRLLSEPP